MLPGQVKPIQIGGQCSAEAFQNQPLPCTSDQPCPLFLELAAAEQVVNRIVVTGNLHTPSYTVESVLLVSEDGGRSWSEGYQRIPMAVLDQLQFLDFEAGWANGHILQSSPRDAFFLLTTDGGKTWRKTSVASEARTGAVEQFWFDSRTHGMLSVDRVRSAENGFRYEQWESITGGESWNVRQVDTKPVPFSRPAREPVLRIRADSSGRTHRLERRDGPRWTLIASFSIAAGECRPPEPQPDPEPQAEPEKSPVEPPKQPAAPKKPPTLRNK